MKKLLKNIISKKSEIVRIFFFAALVAALIVFFIKNTSTGSRKESSLSFFKNKQQQPILYSYPKKTPDFLNAPETTARSAVVVDSKTGITLYEKNPNLRHLPASTTKLLTALVALEKCSPKDLITINNVNGEGTQMGLEVGDQLSVESLLYGMLVNSGNDAAYALAQACGNSYSDFVRNMNLKAKELGLLNSHFQNPAGFDDSDQYSTARDLAKIDQISVANPLIAKIVSTQTAVVTNAHQTKSYYLQNINKLLGQVEGLEGVKTGQTEGSLEILLTKTTRNNNTIIVAILGSQDRFGETKSLIEWAFKNHIWVNP